MASPPWQLGTFPSMLAIFSSEGPHREKENDDQSTGLGEVL